MQIVYIPHDDILTKKEILKEEIEKDIEFLTKCIEKTSENGIGAKTKLGWGRFEFVKDDDSNKEKKKIIINISDIEIQEDWKNES